MKQQRDHFAEEAVMRDEFDQISRGIAARIDAQLTHIKELTHAHRSTRHAKRQLVSLTRARERIAGLRSRFS